MILIAIHYSHTLVHPDGSVNLHSSIVHNPHTLQTRKDWNDVLIVHGLFGSGSNWRAVSKKLRFVDSVSVQWHSIDLLT